MSRQGYKPDDDRYHERMEGGIRHELRQQALAEVLPIVPFVLGFIVFVCIVATILMIR